MIKKLRYKFIRIAMLSIAAVLAVIIAIINVVNYNTVIADADRMLNMIAGNGGSFPTAEPFDGQGGPPGGMKGEEGAGDMFGPGRGMGEMSPETPFETRYFSVVISGDGAVDSVNTDNIAAVDSDEAESYALSAYESGSSSGTVGSYRYILKENDGQTIAVFTDITQKMGSFRSFLFASVLIAAVGIGAVFILIWFLSGRIIRPIAESYEKQKQFITDAGHDIKTPITIISADAEVLEMESGKNEWIDDIRLQTERLSELTRDLIFLSRMEEDGSSLNKIEFPFSDVASETVQSFQALAKTQGKSIDVDIEPMMTLTGEEKSVRQLITILMDNALKYSSDGSRIEVRSGKKGKKISFSVRNDTDEDISPKDMSRMFDRFYRAEKSRNSSTGGSGIGLSVARAVTDAHGGEITAKPSGEKGIVITAVFPEKSKK